MIEERVWVEKYRPSKIADTILPDSIKDTFQNWVDNGDFPNLLLSSGPGTGKTTIAIALCKELDYDYILLNGSNEGRSIDVVRDTITKFASTVSLNGRPKCVIMDEADYMNCLADYEKVLTPGGMKCVGDLKDVDRILTVDGEDLVECECNVLSRSNSDMLRITFDDGSSLDVSADHKFMVNDDEYRVAKDVAVGDDILCV